MCRPLLGHLLCFHPYFQPNIKDLYIIGYVCFCWFFLYMFLKENQAANSIVNYGMFILVQLREIQYPRFAISYRNRNRVLKLWFSLILVWNCSYFLTYVQCGSAYVPVVFIYIFSFHFSFIQNFHWHPKPKACKFHS